MIWASQANECQEFDHKSEKKTLVENTVRGRPKKLARKQ